MLALPLPLIGSIIITFLAVRIIIRDGRHSLSATLLIALAVQGAIAALVQHYGFAVLRPVQPVTAAMVPPLAWLTFTGTTRRPLAWAIDWPHVLGPAFFGFCAFAAPNAIDFGLVLLFAAYGCAILVSSRSGADGTPMMRLDAGDWPMRIWRLIGVALLMSAISDLAISVVYLLGRPELKFYLLDVFSSLILLAIGLLGVSQSAASEPDEPGTEIASDTVGDPAVEAALVARLDAFLAESSLYREPELTLARLARRLNVPAKQLSTAINRQCGESVSRHVNAFRIREACTRMVQGESITTAMLESGFNTKSNFNREFLRIMNTSPSAWRDAMSVGSKGNPARLTQDRKLAQS